MGILVNVAIDGWTFEVESQPTCSAVRALAMRAKGIIADRATAMHVRIRTV